MHGRSLIAVAALTAAAMLPQSAAGYECGLYRAWHVAARDDEIKQPPNFPKADRCWKFEEKNEVYACIWRVSGPELAVRYEAMVKEIPGCFPGVLPWPETLGGDVYTNFDLKDGVLLRVSMDPNDGILGFVARWR